MMIAYFDCFSGLSGDMIVGAFLDAGVPFDWLRDELKKLPLDGYALEMENVKRGGIGGKKFRVKVDCGHDERNLSDIKKIIEMSSLSVNVKDLSARIFERLAEAEARVHGVGVDHIHFHEVGGVDSIIDIVSASLSISYMGIGAVYASEVPLSRGSVSCSHGILPLPAPAVVELLKGVPVYQSPIKGELVTPTGAAFLSTICKGFGVSPEMRLEQIGYGAGERENEGLPNLLRIMIGESNSECGLRNAEFSSESKKSFTPHSALRTPHLEVDTVSVMEANIDDMNPEIYGYVMERLFESGALDISITPAYMKKGRPGNILQVICRIGKEKYMAEEILKETSTIGVRFYRTNRFKLPRRSVEVQTRFGKVRLKVCESPWGDKAQPEYDDCRIVAAEKGVPIREVYDEAVKSFKRGGNDQHP